MHWVCAMFPHPQEEILSPCTYFAYPLVQITVPVHRFVLDFLLFIDLALRGSIAAAQWSVGDDPEMGTQLEKDLDARQNMTELYFLLNLTPDSHQIQVSALLLFDCVRFHPSTHTSCLFRPAQDCQTARVKHSPTQRRASPYSCWAVKP